MPRSEEYDPDEMVRLAHEEDGIVLKVAQRLQCNPSTVYAYMKRYERVHEAVQDARGNAYAELTSSLLDIARGNVDDPDIDRQFAMRKALETLGESISDGMNWTDKQRTQLEGGAGITIAPPETPDRIAPENQDEIENGELEKITDGDT